MNHSFLRRVLLIAFCLLAPSLVSAQDVPRCEMCGPLLRSCIQQGRPALRACLRDCRRASGSACPAGVDVDDCLDAADFQACVSVCRDARRKEIRTCVQASTGCSGHCRPSPGPTATPTPKPGSPAS